MTQATSIRAVFSLKTWPLTVSVSGNGSVSSAPAGISCGTLCNKSYDHGTIVTLTPSPASGAMFSGWMGACSGSGACMVTMDQARSVSASFAPQVVGVAVQKIGNGTGMVTSSPSGITCGSTCNSSYAIGTTVTLTAVADPSSDFSSWGGACSGSGTCVITVAGPTAVSANFKLKSYPLSVTLGGNGSGTVSSIPAGINCGSQCSNTYDHGTMVSLTPSSAVGSNFSGWGGACSGVGACTVPMDQARNVTAGFTLQVFGLSVGKTGSATGLVTSAPAGISCGANCSATYNYNTVVTLTATPASNATFTGWSGACSGTGTCAVTMTQSQNVTAKFELIQLNVSFSGNGTGVVNSTPGGINNCTPSGGGCAAVYNSGTMVTLNATPEALNQPRLSTFIGWSGACTGTGACVVTMNAALSVIARFELKPNIAFVTNTTTTAAFGGLNGGDTICANAASASGLAGTYRALISITGVSASSRLGTASGWVRVDGRPLANSPNEAANGDFFHPLRISNSGGDIGDTSVWTASTGSSSCADFTSSAGAGFGTTGSSAGVGGLGISFGGTGCGASLRLYCFGIDRTSGPLAIVPPTTRRIAFTTTSAWTPGGGISNADAFCQAEATMAGLPGSYLALLATTGASAASRFSVTGPPWTRVDGVPIASTAMAAMGSLYWDMAPNMNAPGTQEYGNAGVWGGAPGLTVVGTLASTCSNWTSTSGMTAVGGRVGYTILSKFFANDATDPCNANFIKLACFQQ